MIENNNETTMNYSVKGTRTRMDVKSDEEVSIIFTDDKLLMILHSQKMFMEYPKQMIEMMMNDMDDGNTDSGIDNIEKYKTSEKNTILGYECTKWTYKDENGTSEVWATDELGSFLFFNNPMQKGKSSLFDLFNNTPFFPLFIKATDNNGELVVKFEATEVIKKNLDESYFSAPQGFQKMTVPGMMNDK
jgi:hypothetical protein